MTMPPLNLGRKDLILLQNVGSYEYDLYFVNEDKFIKFNPSAMANYLATLGFAKKYFRDIPILVYKKVFDIDAPKWKYENNIWLYNAYERSEAMLLYEEIASHEKVTTELKLPLLHRDIFYNVCGSQLGVEYMALKFKSLLSHPRKSNTYTILRGIGGTGKSLLINYLSHLIGLKFSRVINARDFDGNFNAMLKYALIVFVEELPSREWVCNKFLGNIKEFVGNDRISVRAKYKDYEEATNYTNFFITTNHNTMFATMGERRHCEIMSEDRKLETREGFCELNRQNKDFLQALLEEMPEFVRALASWKCNTFDFNSKYIDPKIKAVKAIKAQFNPQASQLLSTIIKGDLSAFIGACGDEVSSLALLKHYDRVEKCFKIPLAVAKEHFILMDYVDLLSEQGIIRKD